MPEQLPPGRSSSGLDVNLAAALTYALGWVTGIAFLLVEKESPFVRFHAMQSTITFGLITMAYVVLNVIPILGFLVAFFILMPLSVVLWLLLILKAFQGEKFKLPMVGDLAEQKA
jgi:uncharacterized membrane protein